MDREVYPLERVGDVFNKEFIAVKVQMDTSRNDDATVKAFYADAHYLGARYKVNAYPTLIFLNPDGSIVDMIVGGVDGSDLIKVATSAINPENDYSAKLKEYEQGKRDLKEMAFLATRSYLLLGDSALEHRISEDYLHSLGKANWLTFDNIRFLKGFTHSTRDIGFEYFLKNADTIDQVMKDPIYAEATIQYILYMEIIAPEIEKSNALNQVPNWNKLHEMLAKKYGGYYADRTITGVRSDWAGRKGYWPEHSKYLVLYVEKYGAKLDTGGFAKALYFNNCAWDIFQHSIDTGELKTALLWSQFALLIDPEAGWMDTHANILYKLKSTGLALKWEQIAATLANGDKAIALNLKKMKSSEPTWPSN